MRGKKGRGANGTLSLDLATPRTGAYLTAATASLGGTLNISGVAGLMEIVGSSSDLASLKTVLIHTVNNANMTGDFAAARW